MTKNHIEAFMSDDGHDDLESQINSFCRRYNYNPISISVIWSAGTYVAFVVVEENDNAVDDCTR